MEKFEIYLNKTSLTKNTSYLYMGQRIQEWTK